MSLMSVTSQGADFMSDYSKHKFWKEDAEKVCDEQEEDIRGKIVIVTGSNTGIGKEAALQLAKRGATVIMAVRDLEKGEAALKDIKKRLEGRELNIEVMKLDLGDLQTVRDFVTTFQSKYSHLDILVNNAGFLDTNPVLQKTKDGFERHIGVNCLGPFLLTRLLLPLLKKGPAPTRVICVGSSNLVTAPLNFMDDLMMENNLKLGDGGMEQYNTSKLCSAICYTKLARDTELTGNGHVKLFQLCPGLVKTDVFRNEKSLFKRTRVTLMLAAVGETPHQGCETIVYLAVSKVAVMPEESGRGEVYRFKKLWAKGFLALNEYLAVPLGVENSNKLYALAEELVGLKNVKSEQ